MNSDGLVDYVTEDTIQLNQGTGFGPAQSWWGKNTDLQYGETYHYNNDKRAENSTTDNYIDINGDGFPDYVNKVYDKDYFRIWLNNGNSLLPEIQWPMSGNNKGLQESWTEYQFQGGGIDLNNIKHHGEIGLLDINGDGLPDWVSKSQNENYFLVRLNSKDGFGSVQSWYGQDKDLSYTFVDDGAKKAHTESDMVDINGDGLPDMVAKHRDNNYYLVSLNLGDKFGPWEEWLTAGDGYDLRYTYNNSDADTTYLWEFRNC